MTKKEQEDLKSKKCVIKPHGDNSFFVSFSLTKGQLITLQDALAEFQTPISSDLDCFMRNAALNADIDFQK